MPRFSKFHKLNLSQHQLDFVDVSNDYDIPVYVDPYAIEIKDDLWAGEASEHIRSFFRAVLKRLRNNDTAGAIGLMSHLHEPSETFMGVSSGRPKGRGVGSGQARQLIRSIMRSKAYQTGLLTDLSEMALYVDGIDRDKISDLTTNVIRELLVDYTQKQCDLYNIPTKTYAGPPIWRKDKGRWESIYCKVPYIGEAPVILMPKYIVRRKLSLDSQEFYNKQITDFLVAEHYRANDSLVHVLKRADGRTDRKVYKTEVREKHPKSKSMITDIVMDNPGLLEMYKEIAKAQESMRVFRDDDKEPSLSEVCRELIAELKNTKAGQKEASSYHKLVAGALTTLFYPDLIEPRIEWEINDGRKRVDLVFTNAGNIGFFAQRRDDNLTAANLVVVECKNYSKDIANAEIDQLLGRFTSRRGKFGILTCRSVDDQKLLSARLRDAAVDGQGFIIVITDDDLITMLNAKMALDEKQVEAVLYGKYRSLLS